MIVPPGGSCGSLFGYDPKHVRKVIQRVNHFVYESILYVRDGVRRGHGYGANSAAVVNSVYVVGSGKRIPVTGAPKRIEPFSREQVHASVNPGCIQLLHAGAQHIEEGLIKHCKIELQSAVRCGARTGTQPWL